MNRMVATAHHNPPASRSGLAACLIALTLTALAFGSCTPKNKGGIEVGEVHISEGLFEKRVAQMKLMFPNVTETQVATQLVEGLAANHVLKDNQMGITREELEQERRQISANEEIKDLFMEVQRIYGAAGEDFLDVGLLPDVAVRQLHHQYQTGEISYGLRETAEDILRESQETPERFADIATEHGANVERLSVDAEEASFHDVSGQVVDLTPDRDLRKQFTQNLALAGQELDGEAVIGVITQTKRGYMLTKVISAENTDVEIEAAFLERPAFKEWFVEVAGNLRVCVHDEDIVQGFDAEARTITLNCD